MAQAVGHGAAAATEMQQPTSSCTVSSSSVACASAVAAAAAASSSSSPAVPVSFEVFEFFAGLGGFHLSLPPSLPVHALTAVEIDQRAAQTYRFNLHRQERRNNNNNNNKEEEQKDGATDASAASQSSAAPALSVRSRIKENRKIFFAEQQRLKEQAAAAAAADSTSAEAATPVAVAASSASAAPVAASASSSSAPAAAAARSLTASTPISTFQLPSPSSSAAPNGGRRSDLVHSLTPPKLLLRLIEQLPPSALVSSAPLERPAIWCMSPPCQPFTHTKDAKQLDSSDPRNAAFDSILASLDAMDHAVRPRHIFLENVKHFWQSTMHSKLLSSMESSRYRFVQYLLSPMQLGIPNHRTRFYLAARKIELHEPSPSAEEWAAMKATLVTIPPGFESQPAASGSAEEAVQLEEEEDEGEEMHAQPAASGAAAAAAAAAIPFVLPKSSTLPLVLPPRNLREFLDDSSSLPVGAVESLVLPLSALAKGFHLSVVSADDARTFCFTGGYGKVIHTSSGSFLLFRGEAPQIEKQQALTLHPLDKSKGGLAAYHGSLRFFSPMELLRLFDFPSWYRFPPHFTLQHCYKLVGNSLNLRVVRTILEQHLEYACCAASSSAAPNDAAAAAAQSNAAASSSSSSSSSAATPPASRLVGIELNPGPGAQPPAVATTVAASSSSDSRPPSQPDSPAASSSTAGVTGTPIAFVGSTPLSVVSLDVAAIVAAAAAVAASTSASGTSSSPAMMSSSVGSPLASSSSASLHHHHHQHHPQHHADAGYIPPALGCSPFDEEEEDSHAGVASSGSSYPNRRRSSHHLGMADAHESAFIADYLSSLDKTVSAMTTALGGAGDSPALGPRAAATAGQNRHGRVGSGPGRLSMDFTLGLGLGSMSLEEEEALGVEQHPSWGPPPPASREASLGAMMEGGSSTSPAVPPMVRRVRSYSTSEPGHTELSFSPVNAALRSPKFGSSLSGVPPTMGMLNLTHSNSTSSNRSSLNSSTASSSPPFHPVGGGSNSNAGSGASSSASNSTSFDMIRQAVDASAQRRGSLQGLQAKSANPSPYSTLKRGTAIRLSHRHSGSNPPTTILAAAGVVHEEGSGSSSSYVLAPAQAHETISHAAYHSTRGLQTGLALHIPEGGGSRPPADSAVLISPRGSGGAVSVSLTTSNRSDRASPHSRCTPMSPSSSGGAPSSEPSPGTPGSVYESSFAQLSSPSAAAAAAAAAAANRHSSNPLSPRIHLMRKISPAGTAAAAAAGGGGGGNTSASPTSPLMLSQHRSSPLSPSSSSIGGGVGGGPVEIRRAISLTMQVRGASGGGGSNSASPSPHVLSSPSSHAARSPGPPSSPHHHHQQQQHYPHSRATAPDGASSLYPSYLMTHAPAAAASSAASSASSSSSSSSFLPLRPQPPPPLPASPASLSPSSSVSSPHSSSSYASAGGPSSPHSDAAAAPPSLPPLPPLPLSAPPSPSLLPMSSAVPPSSPSLKGRGGRRILIHKNSRAGSIVGQVAEETAAAAANEGAAVSPTPPAAAAPR